MGATAFKFAIILGGELEYFPVPFATDRIYEALPRTYSAQLRKAVTGLLSADPSHRLRVGAAIAALGAALVPGELSEHAERVEAECLKLTTCDKCAAHAMCGFCGTTRVCLPLDSGEQGHTPSTWMGVLVAGSRSSA